MVGAGFRADRDAVKAKRCGRSPKIGVKRITSDAHATRGRRLTLSRSRRLLRPRPAYQMRSARDARQHSRDRRRTGASRRSSPGSPTEIDAAIAELDNRYLAGEAAAHARTWSPFLDLTPRSTGENSSRRRPNGSISITVGTAFAPGDANAYVRQSLDDGAGSIYVETVHRLDDLGAVAIWVTNGTTQDALTLSGAGSRSDCRR